MLAMLDEVSDLAIPTQVLGGRQLGIHSMSPDCDVLCRPLDVSVCQVPPILARQSTLCQTRCQALGPPPFQLWIPAWPYVQGSIHAIWQLRHKWKYTNRQCGQLAASSS